MRRFIDSPQSRFTEQLVIRYLKGHRYEHMHQCITVNTMYTFYSRCTKKVNFFSHCHTTIPGSIWSWEGGSTIFNLKADHWRNTHIPLWNMSQPRFRSTLNCRNLWPVEKTRPSRVLSSRFVQIREEGLAVWTSVTCGSSTTEECALPF